MSELKPCPFCGGSASIDRMGTSRVSMQIMCDDCGAFVETGETWIDEKSHWNQRAETENEKRLTEIATKHATRADELYEALERVCSYLSEDGLITTGLEKDIVNAQALLRKLAVIDSNGD